MPVGYNHNVCYRGRVFHAQTEACGPETALIVTHLFLQGAVVTSLRQSYQHLLGAPDREEQLRALMQAQHKQILRELRRGEHDGQLELLQSSLEPTSVAPTPATPLPAVPAAAADLPGEASGAVVPGEASAAPAAVVSTDPESPQGAALLPEPSLGGVSAAELVDDAITEAEERSVRKGQAISIELPLAVSPDFDGRIPMDHPAFGGFPMLEMDLADDQEELELDLEAIAQLDLKAAFEASAAPEPVPPPVLDPPRCLEPVPLPGPLPSRPQTPRGLTEAPGRSKRPSLPVAPIAVELPEGIDTRRRR